MMKQLITTAGIVCLLPLLSQPAAAQDCLGVIGGTALPGTACDDGLPGTGQDTWNTYCVCVGYCEASGGGGQNYVLPGYWCDDGNANTTNDIIDGNCVCGGCMFIQGSPGQLCDDGDASTVLDVVGSWGQCYGWSNHIAGRVFLDLDLSGSFSAGDVPLAGRVVHAGPGANYGITDINGNFNIGLVLPGFYTLTPASGNFDVPSQLFPAIDLSVAGTMSVGNDLAMDPISADADLVAGFSAGAPRPGFTNNTTITCRNEGTAAATGTMTYTFDPQQTPSSMYPAGVVAGNTITWNLPVLGVSESFTAHVDMVTSAGAALGTVLANTVTTTAAPPDGAPANDTYAAGLTVVGSYDPNDIQVSPTTLDMEDMAAGLPVTYLVRFQNTGTYLAEDVRIVDVIPLQLRESSFELVASSHACRAELFGGVLQFLFDDIMLPDSTSNEPGSHGWVRFKMRPQNFLLPGASVSNGVSIHFDFNEPIPTNLAQFDVELGTGMHVQTEQGLAFWPNPAAEQLSVSGPELMKGGSVSIIDLDGRTVLRQNLVRGAASVMLPVDGLADALYSLRVDGPGGSQVHHFVKRR